MPSQFHCASQRPSSKSQRSSSSASLSQQNNSVSDTPRILTVSQLLNDSESNENNSENSTSNIPAHSENPRDRSGGETQTTNSRSNTTTSSRGSSSSWTASSGNGSNSRHNNESSQVSNRTNTSNSSNSSNTNSENDNTPSIQSRTVLDLSSDIHSEFDGYFNVQSLMLDPDADDADVQVTGETHMPQATFSSQDIFADISDDVIFAEMMASEGNNIFDEANHTNPASNTNSNITEISDDSDGEIDFDELQELEQSLFAEPSSPFMTGTSTASTTTLNNTSNSTTTDSASTTNSNLKDTPKTKRLGDLECPICYDSPEYLCVIPCGHLYCRDCISKALTIKESCSICRKRTRLKDIVFLSIATRKKEKETIQINQNQNVEKAAEVVQEKAKDLKKNGTDSKGKGKRVYEVIS